MQLHFWKDSEGGFLATGSGIPNQILRGLYKYVRLGLLIVYVVNTSATVFSAGIFETILRWGRVHFYTLKRVGRNGS